MSSPFDPGDLPPVMLPDLARVAETALGAPSSGGPYSEAAWTRTLYVAAATLPGVTPGEWDTITARLRQHVLRECGVTDATHPACAAHPLVQTIIALVELTDDHAAALHPILRGPACVAVHGIAFDAAGVRVGTPWAAVAWPTVPDGR